MTSSIPDSFSSEELVRMLADAPSDVTDQPQADGPYSGLTKEQVIELAETTVQNLHEQCGHPIAQKVVLDIIIRAFLGWHSESGMKESRAGDHRSALFWSRDAGKFQAIMCILDTIGVCDDDFTVTA